MVTEQVTMAVYGYCFCSGAALGMIMRNAQPSNVNQLLAVSAPFSKMVSRIPDGSRFSTLTAAPNTERMR